MAGHKFAWEYQDLAQDSVIDSKSQAAFSHSFSRMSSMNDSVNYFARHPRSRFTSNASNISGLVVQQSDPEGMARLFQRLDYIQDSNPVKEICNQEKSPDEAQIESDIKIVIDDFDAKEEDVSEPIFEMPDIACAKLMAEKPELASKKQSSFGRISPGHFGKPKNEDDSNRRRSMVVGLLPGGIGVGLAQDELERKRLAKEEEIKEQRNKLALKKKDIDKL